MKISKETLYTGLNNSLLWSETVGFSFVKKYWREILIVIAVLVAIFSIKANNRHKEEIKQLKIAAQFKDSGYSSALKEWQDENKKAHTEVDNLYIDRFAILDQYDSISHLLSIKPKQILTASQTAVKLVVNEKLKVDTFYTKVPCNGQDSVYVASAYDLSWRDNYIHVWGELGTDNDSIHVTGTDTLNRVDYWKRKWFLASKHYYSDFNNSNPHIKVVGYKGIESKYRDKKWSLGLSVQYGYPVNYIQLKQPIVSFGVSLQYSLIRF